MAIVDFEQDPTGPYGTGNFRDDRGRVMYLHDPETAQQFVKTMPGAKLPAQVASESDDIASNRMDGGASLRGKVGLESDMIARQRFGGNAPGGGPDRRLAENRPPEPEYYDPNAAGRDVAASVDAPPSPGAALVDTLDQTQAKLAPPAPAPAAPSGAPAPAPAAPAAPPATAPAAPAAANPGAALVSNYDATQAKLGQRSQPRDIDLPQPYSSGNIPLSGVRSSRNVSVEEGRPVENALEQLGDEAPEVQNQIDQIRSAGIAKDAAVDRAYGAQLSSTDAYRKAQEERAQKAAAERKAAEQQLMTVQRELKANDQSLDPDRVIKNMSTGKRIGMIVLAMLNGAFGATLGQKDNGVMQAINLEIDRDIDRQKMEVANRKASLGNDYKRYLDLGLDAKTAEALARDKAEQALFQYKDLEAKRAGAQGENARAAELAIAPLRLAWAQRRGDVMKETESRVKRAAEESQAHEVPPVPVMTPQDVLALMNIQNQKIANANTEDIAAAVGHPVTPDEGKQIRTDAQDYGKRRANIAAARAQVDQAAKEMGLFKGPDGYSGTPDSGVPLSEKRRRVNNEYTLLKRMDVMGMAREPSAALQDEFGRITARPFWDSDATWQLNAMQRVLDRADQELRGGFSDEALAFYNRVRPAAPTQGRAPAAGKPAASPGRPGVTPAQRTAAEAERRKTEQMLNAPPGDLRSE